MDLVVSPKLSSLENGFVKETASFIVSDDLHVMPNAFETSICLLQKLGVHNIDAIEEQMVHISKNEVVDLLIVAMLSKTPLTDFILKAKQLNSRNPSEIVNGKVPSGDDRQLSIKITMRKSTGEILFAEGEKDFADFIFSFLTFPLGGVLHILESSTPGSCMDNLYKSLVELGPDNFLLSQNLNDKLTNPPCCSKFELKNQILPIRVAPLPVYYCHTYFKSDIQNIQIRFTKEKKCPNPKYSEMYVPLKLVDPNFSYSGEFVKGPSLYMVTDNLVVTPMSSAYALSYLNKSNITLVDLEERHIKIGRKEGLSLLKASLISTSALTIGLQQFTRTVKEDKRAVIYGEYLKLMDTFINYVF